MIQVKSVVQTYLCSSEHHTVQKDFQLLESRLADPHHAIFLDRRQNFIVPETRLKNEKSAEMYRQKEERYPTWCMGL